MAADLPQALAVVLLALLVLAMAAWWARVAPRRARRGDLTRVRYTPPGAPGAGFELVFAAPVAAGGAVATLAAFECAAGTPPAACAAVQRLRALPFVAARGSSPAALAVAALPRGAPALRGGAVDVAGRGAVDFRPFETAARPRP